MNQENALPKSVQAAAKNMSGTQAEAEYKARTAPPEIQRKVKALLDRSRCFSTLSDAVKQAMHDRRAERWSHILAPWSKNAGKYWVVRRDDPDYGLICFSGLRFVVPFTVADAAWEALATDTIEEI